VSLSRSLTILAFLWMGGCLAGVLWYGHVINRELRRQANPDPAVKRPRRRRPLNFSRLLMLLPVGYLAATILIGGHAVYLIG